MRRGNERDDDVKNRAAQNQRAARAKIAACARVALDVCDRLARLGREDDDRPRLWLLALDRWGVTGDGAGLAAATRAGKAWSDPIPSDDPRWPWRWALFCLRDGREDTARHVTHVDRHVVGTLNALAKAFPDTIEAATHSVQLSYDTHLNAVVREQSDAILRVRRDRAATDREEAEYQLGVRVPARDCAAQGETP